MRRVTDRFRQRVADRGFTLVEMIIAIVLAGILMAMVGLFGRAQIDAYFDVADRSELSDAADTALRRIARDLQSALPNSVRLSGDFLEFVPIRDAGRYRAELGGGAGDDVLDFTNVADNRFDVLGPPVTIGVGDQLVIFNLGQPGSDVYQPGTSRRAATPGVNLAQVSFAPAGAQFPLASPQNRFQIIGGPVTYQCAANAANPAVGRLLRHSCYDFQQIQPAAFGALPVHAGCAALQADVLVDNVSFCSFNYVPAVLQRNGLVVLRLTLTRGNESVELLHQVDVLNTP